MVLFILALFIIPILSGNYVPWTRSLGRGWCVHGSIHFGTPSPTPPSPPLPPYAIPLT